MLWDSMGKPTFSTLSCQQSSVGFRPDYGSLVDHSGTHWVGSEVFHCFEVSSLDILCLHILNLISSKVHKQSASFHNMESLGCGTIA